MSAAWVIENSEGQVLPGLTGASRIELGRKVLPGRYDPFRLHVSASYREIFERDLGKLLALKGWRMVRMKSRRRIVANRSAFAPFKQAA